MRITPDDKQILDDVLTRILNYKSISAEIRDLCINSIKKLSEIEDGCAVDTNEVQELPGEIDVTLTEGMGKGMTIRVPVHGQAQKNGCDYWVSIGQGEVKLYAKK